MSLFNPSQAENDRPVGLFSSFHLSSTNDYLSGASSFSDNSEKLFSTELSSTSSTSESDSKCEIRYASMIPTNGVMKITEAQLRKKQREMRIICNRKINYFLQKHAHIIPSKI